MNEITRMMERADAIYIAASEEYESAYATATFSAYAAAEAAYAEAASAFKTLANTAVGGINSSNDMTLKVKIQSYYDHAASSYRRAIEIRDFCAKKKNLLFQR